MNVETWALDRIIPYARNPRKNEGAVDKVAASLAEFGWQQPVVVDGHGVVVVGHTRLLAAKKLGWAEAPVVVASELTAAQVKAYRLADNRTNEEAEWDLPLLSLELDDLTLAGFDLGLTGFDPEELAAFDALANATEDGVTDADEAPEPPKTPVSVLGDLWILGEHRVLCGDSTSAEATLTLFAGAVPDAVFTDPPYGVDIVKGSKVGGGGNLKFGKAGGQKWVNSRTYAVIEGDSNTDAARDFYAAAIAAGVQNFVIWGGNYFTDFLPPSPCWLIWDKQNTGNFADVEMAWTSYAKGARLYPYLWNGLSRAGDRKSELVTRVHPTQKPVGLFDHIFADFPFESCYDGFLGSGSTLIACEKQSRRCYGMELSPAYVDVIVTRWQNFSSKKAVHEDGTPFDDRAALANAA